MAPTDFKIVVLGSGGVGKSALTVRFISGIFVIKYDPTIEDSYRKQVEVDGEQWMLDVLDTAGTEQFTALRDLYFKNGQGFLLVYSIIVQSTYYYLIDLIEQISHCKEELCMAIVGNKTDLADQRVVTYEQGLELASKYNCAFRETSAKNQVNVELAFTDLVRQYACKMRKNKKTTRKRFNCTLL